MASTHAACYRTNIVHGLIFIFPGDLSHLLECILCTPENVRECV